MLRTTSKTGVVPASPVMLPERAVVTEKTATAIRAAMATERRRVARSRTAKRMIATAT
jgi:hypothetical protein